MLFSKGWEWTLTTSLLTIVYMACEIVMFTNFFIHVFSHHIWLSYTMALNIWGMDYFEMAVWSFLSNEIHSFQSLFCLINLNFPPYCKESCKITIKRLLKQGILDHCFKKISRVYFKSLFKLFDFSLLLYSL